ncbi:MAG: hypothetical protein IJP54_05400 [Synergistaceae bacterium]|nr:hypothetical protein [Synergistaceae bacterium]
MEASLLVLHEESQRLKEQIQALRNEAIALSANVLLGQTAFEPGMSRAEIIARLNTLKQQVRLNVLARISNQSLTRMRDISVEFEAESETELIDGLVSADMRQYVRAVSVENSVAGENMRVIVRFESGTSIVMYPDGEPVYRKFFANGASEKAEDIMQEFLRELRSKAIHDGILPEPSTNNIGTMSGEEFFSAVDTLSKIDSPVIISALASGDIYTEGPVVIDIVFEE